MPQLTDRKNRQQTWLSNPQSDHRVHFYQMENDLIDSLGEYVSTGLDKKETCIVMAKPATIIKLNKKLRAGGVNLSAVLSSGQYIAYDADDLLAQFMRQGVPDLEEFSHTLGRVMSLATGRGQPIRAYGEMVAILLEQRNMSGLMELENYWNDLIQSHVFSLYCAYPESPLLDNPKYKHMFSDICGCHHAENLPAN